MAGEGPQYGLLVSFLVFVALAKALAAPVPGPPRPTGGPAPAVPMSGNVVEIPAQTANVGSATLPDAPVRTVNLPAYAIDRFEVTVGAFETFARTAWSRREWWSEAGWSWAAAHPGGAGAPLRAAGRAADHPVVAVTWFEADAYCRSAGGRLPTEDEWEVAACGSGGRRFPWGDEERERVRWYDEGKFGHIEAVQTARVTDAEPGSAGPNGLTHAAGNVWEWTGGAYGPPDTDGTPRWRTLRGGSYTNLPSYCTCAHREPAEPSRVTFTTGFRCAYDR